MSTYMKEGEKNNINKGTERRALHHNIPGGMSVVAGVVTAVAVAAAEAVHDTGSDDRSQDCEAVRRDLVSGHHSAIEWQRRLD